MYEVAPSAVMLADRRYATLHEVAVGGGEGIRGIHELVRLSRRLSISDTCSLDACPCPVMAIFIFMGAYSYTSMPWLTAAAMATPCARPSFSMDCMFFPKKGASMAISSGRCSSIVAVTLSYIMPNR